MEVLEPLATIAFYLGVVAYSVASTLFFVDLARKQGAQLAATWAPRVLGIGVVLHSAHVGAASARANASPFESLHFALSLSALIAAAVYLLLRRRARIHAIGAFVSPIALTFLVGAQFVSVKSPTSALPGSLLAVHVTANLLGIGFFLLAGGASVFYLVQERRLKEKRLGSIRGRLPPLDALDVTEHRLLLAGFPLLTLGIATGAIWAGQLEQGAEVARALLAYTTWLLVAAVLILRAVAGWRGRRAAYGTIAGVLCMMLVILVYVVRPAVGDGL